MNITPRHLLVAPLAAALVLAACGGDDSSSSTTQAAVTIPAVSEAPATDAAGTEVPAGTQVNANTATAEEITAALEAAGVANADRWTDEILEYRPYPTDDPTFASLREELAKYNPADGVIDQIISVLTL